MMYHSDRRKEVARRKNNFYYKANEFTEIMECCALIRGGFHSMLLRKCEKIGRISLFATRRMWSGSQIHLRDRRTLWNSIISNSTNSSCLIPRHYSNNTKYTTCTSMRTTPKGKYKIYAIAEQGNSTYGAREYHLLPLLLKYCVPNRILRNLLLYIT